MNTTDYEKEIAALKRELSKVQADFAKLAEDSKGAAKVATDAAQEAASIAQQKLEAEIHKLSEKFGEARQTAVKGGEQALASVQDQIQERPLPSFAIALGIGFALGMLIGRRD
jgi:ElaB/YqjD/DUF883 family membrane-anchored ribosome-binding protein